MKPASHSATNGQAAHEEVVALEITGAYKRFRKESGPQPAFWKRSGRPKRELTVAVDNISIRVPRGEIFGLLGANGSGKSTLIRLVSTLLIPDGGDIRVFGYDVHNDERIVRRLINRVSVEASFFKKLSALENLMYAARLYDMPIDEARQKAVFILGKLGMAEKRLYEPLENMSRGMQQKVAIARGLLTAPVLLLLDEPTTGLDPRSKQDVQRFIQRMRREHDTTVFLTTHDMDEADRLCDRIAVIADGKIVALDTPAELKRQIGAQSGKNGSATMEDVFLALTGKSLDDDFEVEAETAEMAEPAYSEGD
ncbi:MAG TPA: ABC transporter ATP-binding protein [Kouleothrix sp.]|uniref:ABC transporter ATP-binding protein n=1 Tax=Kouleothrix sp. TaxID=2779161 RepID=UPI002BDF6833|nr:ABC transporter ATP-binding protein [Kouleothrix sp.]HRC75865.1 ABC transporter ATP-binding protein [Kouleothrix sp.]